ncbi:MAG: hypothetical protein KKE44_26115 [Proteobacteria bacterium]|nr:hypothetical protein [Pseudomonadota bacterium]MBU2627585.1 hypothetical protein [Pseudomonadota bacterium]
MWGRFDSFYPKQGKSIQDYDVFSSRLSISQVVVIVITVMFIFHTPFQVLSDRGDLLYDPLQDIAFLKQQHQLMVLAFDMFHASLKADPDVVLRPIPHG